MTEKQSDSDLRPTKSATKGKPPEVGAMACVYLEMAQFLEPLGTKTPRVMALEKAVRDALALIGAPGAARNGPIVQAEYLLAQALRPSEE